MVPKQSSSNFTFNFSREFERNNQHLFPMKPQLIISERVELNEFAKISLILQAKVDNDTYIIGIH